MSSRKRERQESIAVERGATNASPSSSRALDRSRGEESVKFSTVVWNEISTLLFAEMMQLIRSCFVTIIRSWATMERAERLQRVKVLSEDLSLTWEAGKHLFLAPSEEENYSSLVKNGLDQLISYITHITGCQEDCLALCRQYMRLLEDYGFGVEDGGELGALMGTLKFNAFPNGYAYSKRTTPSSPVLCTSTEEEEGEPPSGKKAIASTTGESSSEAMLSSARVGYVVSVSDSPNLSSLLNTEIQLMEPRKRRPSLDEYRIFSHPKKTATHGVEDALVDEELHYRALVVLTHHFDTHGSLHGLSPFARFALYNLLGKSGNEFKRLCDQRRTSQAMDEAFRELRETLERRLRAMEQVRPSVYEAAQRVGWLAVSAQWRDQVLSVLQDVEEHDWYELGDTMRGPGIARFPNYAHASPVKQLAMSAIEKMYLVPFSANPSEEKPEVDGQSGMILTTVKAFLLPILEGVEPDWKAMDHIFSGGASDEVKRNKLASKLRYHYTKLTEPPLPITPTAEEKVSWLLSTTPSASRKHMTMMLLLPSIAASIQCLAKLFDICSAAYESCVGIEAFSKKFLASPWENEEDILAYLFAEEPTNIGITPLVAIPKICNDLFSSIDFFTGDTQGMAVISEGKRVFDETSAKLSGTDPASGAATGCSWATEPAYIYWKIVSTALDELDRGDELLFLSVEKPPTSVTWCQANQLRWYSEGALERAPRVWPTDMITLVNEVERIRKSKEPTES